MQSALKKTLKISGIIIGLFMLLYAGLLLYVSLNKKSIIARATADISRKLNGKMTVGDVDLSLFATFPYASVALENVEITDTLFNQHKHPFIQAEKLFARLSISRLVRGNLAINGVKVDKGLVYFFTDSNGYSNTYLLSNKNSKKPGTGHTPADDIAFKTVSLEDVHFVIDDRKKDKLHDFEIHDLDVTLEDLSDSVLELSTKADLKVNSLAFNKSAGSFLKGHTVSGKFEVLLNTTAAQLRFDSIDLSISGQPFNLSGKFDLEGQDPQFSFSGHTKKIEYPFAKSLLTEKIARSMSIAGIDKTADANVYLSGPLNGGDPLIQAFWTVKGAHLATPFFDFDNANFKGYYTDEVTPGLPRKDPNSRIVITDFFATWHDLPVSSKSIEILNLYEPLVTCDLRSAFPLTKLNDVIGSRSVIMESGDCSVDLAYKGPIERNRNTNSFLNGSIAFINGVINYAPRGVRLKNANGKLSFRNSNVFVEGFTCDVLDNKIRMEGTALNLLTLVNSEIDKATIDWKIYSPALNLNSFLYLLHSRKNIGRKKNSKSSGLDDIANKIDDVLEKGRVSVKLTTPVMTYKKLTVHDVNADVALLQDRYLIKNVSMSQAGGNIQLNGALIGASNDRHTAAVNVALQNVDVNRVFDEFNDFGQTGIRGKNLSGKLTAQVNANMVVNSLGDVLPSSVKSTVDFSLKNGALINFEPLEKIQEHIFKKRDFANIKFAELSNRLDISDQEVKINRMEIQSNVLSLFVEGIYSMKGNTDISIQVPLSNLKKRSQDYIPKNIGVDGKAGPSVYLRGKPGPDGNIQIRPDIFRKFRKN